MGQINATERTLSNNFDILYLSELPVFLWLDLRFPVDCSVEVFPLKLLEIIDISDLGASLIFKII